MGFSKPVKSKDGGDDDEVTQKNLLLVKTQFLRNMSYRIDTDMIHRLTRSSTKFREIDDRSTIPNFVQTIFDVGEEYGIMMENVLKYYDCVNDNFGVVEGPLLIRNILADAKTDATRQMLRVSKTTSLVDVEISHSVPISEMIADGPVIKECLQELIFNGLRHDDNSHVSVHVSCMSHSPCQVTFAVQNRGIKISDKDLLSIFTPFNNIHRGVVHGSGLGIGLARCKLMAHKVGGDLCAQNGQVTTFSLYVPMKHEKEIRLQNDGISVTYPRRKSEFLSNADVSEESSIFQNEPLCAVPKRPSVLVVDDSVVARKQFEKMMKHVDIDVDLCEGSLQCLEMIKTKTYDLVCLDIIMPVMSGVTCAHHLREGKTANRSCPIVIITADNSVETRQLCACIQNSTVLEKPAKRNVLYRTIMSSLQGLPQKEWIRMTWHKKHSSSVFSESEADSFVTRV